MFIECRKRPPEYTHINKHPEQHSASGWLSQSRSTSIKSDFSVHHLGPQRNFSKVPWSPHKTIAVHIQSWDGQSTGQELSFPDIVFWNGLFFHFYAEGTVRGSALQGVGADWVRHAWPTYVTYPLVPYSSLWKRESNMFSYHSRSILPKGDKHFTMVLLWTYSPGEGWVWRGVPEFLETDLRLWTISTLPLHGQLQSIY